MSVLGNALALAGQGVRIFPCRPNSKLPAWSDFPRRATDEPEALKRVFTGTTYNSGIACGQASNGLYLVGFDIDFKSERNGYESLELLAEMGFTLPDTWSQRTPSGGEHRLFWSPVQIRQGVDVCGVGIDLRSEGGYLVGPGSRLEMGEYTVVRNLPIRQFPDWAIQQFEKKASVHRLKPSAGKPARDQAAALKDAVAFLNDLAPVKEGRRNHFGYAAACKLKELGLVREQIIEVMLEYWRCEPMLERHELEHVVDSALRYSQKAMGAAAPENLFPAPTDADIPPPDPEEEDPIDEMNRRFFYYAAEGVSRVCEETTREGRFHLERYPVSHFHEKYLAKKILYNGKSAALTKVWMESELRRTYDYVRFDPSGQLPVGAYNLWRGFAVAPTEGESSDIAIRAVELFMEHVEQNICAGDKALAKWILSWMAHLFQKPGEKPTVALVLQGEKGTGKTILSSILNRLIGRHSVILANKNHVLGHFNSVMEDKLLVTLDEAFWSGDKSIEGVLKDAITGTERVITYKGAEPYIATVYDRFIITGNEDWLVPASGDERRFAVFKVAGNRRRDSKFFGTMVKGMEAGGYELLMHHFLKYDISAFNPHHAPSTKGLEEQKLQSLNVFYQWWYECLSEGYIVGSGLPEWPASVTVTDFGSSFGIYLQNEGHRGFRPSRISMGMMLKKCARSIGGSVHVNGHVRAYNLPSLPQMRGDWDHFAEHKTEWPN